MLAIESKVKIPEVSSIISGETLTMEGFGLFTGASVLNGQNNENTELVNHSLVVVLIKCCKYCRFHQYNTEGTSYVLVRLRNEPGNSELSTMKWVINIIFNNQCFLFTYSSWHCLESFIFSSVKIVRRNDLNLLWRQPYA